MTRRLMLSAILLSSLATAGAARLGNAGGSGGLIVHEWGTFTSIAGGDGRAVQWLPQQGPSDLPDFVGRINCSLKDSLSGKTRMETPVIYFYAAREMTVNVNVRFREGVITEWFPRPTAATGDTINDAFRGDMAWNGVRVTPGGDARFPIGREANHYYLARATDAAPLQVGSERERFLFYRGVGTLAPPVTALVTAEDRILVEHTNGRPLGDIILFENRDGATAFEAQHASGATATFSQLQLEGEGALPYAKLEDILVKHGLYRREAKAMVDSWRGSWFEQGTRLFYILSGSAVDAMLPLRVDPTPDEVRRVFVGRLEIATTATLDEVREALDRGDTARLSTYGRFLQPIGDQLIARASGSDRPAIRRRLDSARATWMKTWAAPSACSAVGPLRQTATTSSGVDRPR